MDPWSCIDGQRFGYALSHCRLVCAVPGVSETGALNHHFIRDLGAVYIVAGVALPRFALDTAARPAAQAGAAFLVMHAIVHLWDAAAGREHVHALLVEVPDVFLPAILA